MATSKHKQLYLIEVFKDEDLITKVSMFVSTTPDAWIKFYRNQTGNRKRFLRTTLVKQMNLS